MEVSKVGVFIAFAVSCLIHQLGRSVAQVQGYRAVGRIVFDEGERLVDGHVGRIALGRGGQVDRGFGCFIQIKINQNGEKKFTVRK